MLSITARASISAGYSGLQPAQQPAVNSRSIISPQSSAGPAAAVFSPAATAERRLQPAQQQPAGEHRLAVAHTRALMIVGGLEYLG
jgi:hypothetical protein